MTAGYPMAAVRKDDLDVLLVACLKYLPDEPHPDIPAAFARLNDARQPGVPAPELEERPLPDGIFGRVELPGFRNHTGWITEETKFGAQVAVVRDWNGAVVAEVCIGPMCQVVHLPTPLKRPDPVAALPAGGSPWADDDENLDDDDGTSWERGD